MTKRFNYLFQEFSNILLIIQLLDNKIKNLLIFISCEELNLKDKTLVRMTKPRFFLHECNEGDAAYYGISLILFFLNFKNLKLIANHHRL